MSSTQGKIKEKSHTDIHEPRKYKVIMFNDDFTTMQFVVDVLQTVFRHTHEESEALMLNIHRQGQAVVGVYPMDIALTKVQKTTIMARQENFPLKVICQKD